MPILPLLNFGTACPRHLWVVKYPFVVFTLIMTCLSHLECLVVWLSFIITLLIDSSWCPVLIGVFVGYSRTQKGYWVYFPDQRKYVVSVDVTFFEYTRYFSSTSSSTPHPAPSPSPIPPSSSPSSPAHTSHLPTLMDPIPLLSLSPP